jgi:hypothetical protein
VDVQNIATFTWLVAVTGVQQEAALPNQNEVADPAVLPERSSAQTRDFADAVRMLDHGKVVVTVSATRNGRDRYQRHLVPGGAPWRRLARREHRRPSSSLAKFAKAKRKLSLP